MPPLDRLRRAARASVRTRRRAVLTAVAVAAVCFAAWHGVRVYRGHRAVVRAEEALARYDFPAARDHLKSAADLRPRHPPVWLLAAQAARRDGDLETARDHLWRYRALSGATPDGRLEEGLQHVQRGDVERDVYDLLAKVDAGHPAAEQILEALAVGSVHAYQFDLVGLWLHHLLTNHPKNPVGRLIRAQTDDVLGKKDRAAAVCRDLLADFPDNHKARALLAGLLFRSHQYADAAEQYEQLRRDRPDDAAPLLGLARCRDRMGQQDHARPLLRELEERFPEHSEALLECAKFALAEDRVADAERLLRRGVQLAPYDHEVHYQLGLCLERIGKADEARHHLDRFKQIETDLNRLEALLRLVVNHPRDPAPRREAGLICLRNGQPTEGLRWLKSALEVAPDDAATHAALADYYGPAGDNELAGYHRRRSGVLFPGDPLPPQPEPRPPTRGGPP